MKEADRVKSFGTTVFSEFSRLAVQSRAVNLGQGFPDFDGPDEIKQVAIDAIGRGVNQYAITTGSVTLRRAIAAHAKRFYDQTIDPDTMVTVTSGATEAIADAVLAFVNPGDEVVVFEPSYDSYVASIVLAGGTPRYVRLRVPDASHPLWWVDSAELSAAFNDKTRLVIVNTPNNPTGKVFTADELREIGALAARFDAVILSDEVYEHLVFEPARHVRPATLPELADRTITISSGGKSFSFTGWKIGWALGPAPLVKAVQKAHQFVTFATASPFQEAIAAALELPDTFFDQLRRDYQRRRDFLSVALSSAGMKVLPCEGSYFLIADISSRGFADDVAFCRDLTTRVGVAAIPPSAFYSDDHKADARHLARFAFCKSDPVLREAADRLAAKT